MVQILDVTNYNIYRHDDDNTCSSIELWDPSPSTSKKNNSMNLLENQNSL